MRRSNMSSLNNKVFLCDLNTSKFKTNILQYRKSEYIKRYIHEYRQKYYHSLQANEV